ncbi:MAG TPA: sorbosone dehydrogenase, partial [Lichenihabitans sp.]|nr:sorbosone dehydrogenase [Lichenihabitans sp.]
MRSVWLAAAAASALLTASTAFAQDATTTDTPSAAAAPDATMKKLEDFKSTGARGLVSVPQTGPRADAIRKTLETIKLPPGFKISLYAMVPDARMIAVGPQGVV